MNKLRLPVAQKPVYYGHIKIEPRDPRWEPVCQPLFFDFFSASVEVYHATQYAIRNAEISGRGRLAAMSNGTHEYFDFCLLDNRPTQHPNPRY